MINLSNKKAKSSELIMNDLKHNYEQVLARLNAANQSANRDNGARLLAVSKTKPAADIRTLYEAGQRDFGENYLQEALAKQQELNDLSVTWHYIGSIQRNKTRDIATHFHWVHTIERAIIAERLNDQRGDLAPLNVLIQVNIDDEDSKSGVQPDEVLALVDVIHDLPKLVLRGLMVIPAKEGSDAFIRTRALFDEVRRARDLPNWDMLSMGMSGDMVDAVAHGSTIVRVGTALFGERDYSK